MIKFKLTAVFAMGFILAGCGSDNDDSSVVLPEPAITLEDKCVSLACEANNKQIIQQIYTDVINQHDLAMLTDIYASEFTSHRHGGAATLNDIQAHYSESAQTYPNHLATIKRVVADGEFVAVHWHFSDNTQDEFSGFARVDLYQLFAGKVVEHWDVSMRLASETVSGNSALSDLYEYQNEVVVTEQMEIDNKALVANFYSDTFNNGNVALIDELLYEGYIQHNVWLVDGPEPFRNFVLSGQSAAYFDLTLSEGDLVWTFDRRNNLSLVDIFRFDNDIDKVVEHWDIWHVAK